MRRFLTALGLGLTAAVSIAVLSLTGADARPTSAVAAAAAKIGGVPAFREDELIIKFRPKVGISTMSQVNRGIKAVPLKSFGRTKAQHVKLPPGLPVEKAISMYEARGEVEYAEPNYKATIQSVPSDPHMWRLWGLNHTGQIAGIADSDIDAPEAWEVTTGSAEVVLAVVDTGVDYNHPDLAPNIWTNPGEIAGNGIDDDGNGYVDDVHGANTGTNEFASGDPMAIHPHGTHVSGTIGAAGNNGDGIAGVNWTTTILPMNVFTPEGDDVYTYTSSLLEATEYMLDLKAAGVNIVATNNSYGGGGYSQSERDAIVALRDAGILFIAAAGNDSSNNDSNASYPANYQVDNVISVAATNSSDLRASFSNYGTSTVHIAAPGQSILSTVPTEEETLSSVVAGASSYGVYGIEFGGTTDAAGITGAAYDCGQALASTDCPAGVSGNIALIERGGLINGQLALFHQKVTNAQAAGAVAAIIYNNVDGSFNPWSLGSSGSWIPAIAMSRSDGLALVAQGAPSVTVINAPSRYAHYDGTSMATPHVTGVAGLVAAMSPDASYSQIRAAILQGADVKSSLTPTISGGRRLNAAGALAALTDTDPPVTTLSVATPSGWDQWYVSAPSITLNSTDPGATIRYQWNSTSAIAWSEYASPIVAPSGTNTLYYYSTDGVGNEEVVKSRIFKVDAAPPTASALITPSAPNGANGWYRTAPVIALSSSEAGGIKFQWNSTSSLGWLNYVGSLSPVQGLRTLYFYSVDGAGNQGATQSRAFKVDLGAPSVGFASAARGSGSYIKGTVTYPATAWDSVSGISRVQLFDGSTYKGQDTGAPYAVPLYTTFLKNGKHTISLRAYDNAGNLRTVARTYYVDNYKPRTYAPYSSSVKRYGWAKLYYKAYDPYSPQAYMKIVVKNSKGQVVKTLYPGWKGTNTLRYQWFKVGLSKGTYYFYIYATDKAGGTQYNVARNKLIVK